MMPYEEFKGRITEEERRIVRAYEDTSFYAQGRNIEDKLHVLEVGSGWGIFSRVCLERGYKLTTIDKIDGYGRPQFMLHTQGFEFEQIHGDSQHVLPSKETEWANRFGLVYVDGDHGQDGASKDLKWGWLFTKPNGIMMVDDVFHKENWEIEQRERKGFNFGVTRALWGFIQHNRDTIRDIRVVPVGHGLVVIEKNI